MESHSPDQAGRVPLLQLLEGLRCHRGHPQRQQPAIRSVDPFVQAVVAIEGAYLLPLNRIDEGCINTVAIHLGEQDSRILHRRRPVVAVTYTDIGVEHR